MELTINSADCFSLFQEEQSVEKKSDNLVHGYTRDDLEIEIMLGPDVRLGTLACTATKPLRVSFVSTS